MKKAKVKKYETSEDREREYWSVHDSAEVLDWSKAKKTVFPNLKPSHSSISLRLPKILLEELKMIANKKDVPYQSLMKVYLTQCVKEELVKK